MSQMSHKSSYESVSDFSSKVWIRFGVGFSVRVGVRVRVWIRVWTGFSVRVGVRVKHFDS